VLTDYHMHLQPDGVGARADAAASWDAHGGPRSQSWIGRYVEVARSRAIGEIAITEHVYRFAEVRDWHDVPFWREEATEDVAGVVAAVGEAAEAGLPVLLGVEMDWLPHRVPEIRRFLRAHPFDVVLGSVHWLGTLGVDDPFAPAAETIGADEVWDRYLDELVAATRSGLFDVLAHPDLPKVFGHRPSAAARRRLDDLVGVVAEAGVAVECSSAGLRKPVRELYPHPDLLARFRRAGVPVTLSSDAHRPEDVGADYSTAVAALRGAGYTEISRFRRRERTPTPIRDW
jgi:histidinol-phosphatase (PHP family)